MTAGSSRDVAATPSGEGMAGAPTFTARRIAEMVSGVLEGDPDALIRSVAPIETAGPGTLTFLASAKYAPSLARCSGGVVLVTEELRNAPGGVDARIIVRKPHEALISVIHELYPAPPLVSGVDPSARIGRGARIGQAVSIGPFVVIGDGAVIGDRCRLDAQVTIGEEVSIGSDCHLNPSVTVYSGSTIGNKVIIHAGARIGSDGFGYVFADGGHRKIPHIGNCRIEDDVEIGANTTIDRGSPGDTVVGSGTRIDNLVQVGHNVTIGRGCLIMAQVGIAGSVKIGEGCVLAGQVGVGGHVEIGAGARVGGQAGVFGDIPAGETWSGYPARPHRESLRSHAALFKLSGMIRKLERLLAGRE
ncbi:MAG: UDP-3-O-(3-hydroxymyristoyl)glucosamine N-acyltransferase [Gemmatimonadota bacterium]